MSRPVHEPGARLTIEKDIDVTVLARIKRPGAVLYEVGYWDAGCYHVEVLHDFQIPEPDDA